MKIDNDRVDFATAHAKTQRVGRGERANGTAHTGCLGDEVFAQALRDAPAGPAQLQYGLTPSHYLSPALIDYAGFWPRFVAALIDGGYAGRLARVASEGSFIPLGDAAGTVLLSEQSIEDAARALLR